MVRKLANGLIPVQRVDIPMLAQGQKKVFKEVPALRTVRTVSCGNILLTAENAVSQEMVRHGVD